jgi:hypothetical protein
MSPKGHKRAPSALASIVGYQDVIYKLLARC